jgi:hypothetical protein
MVGLADLAAVQVLVVQLLALELQVKDIHQQVQVVVVLAAIAQTQLVVMGFHRP